MADKSTLPPNQDEKKFEQDKPAKGGRPQENKGYSEDQPGHPVRTTGSMRPDQESHLSSRETGPGCQTDKPEE